MASKDAGVATTIAALRPETDGHNVTVKVRGERRLPPRSGRRTSHSEPDTPYNTGSELKAAGEAAAIRGPIGDVHRVPGRRRVREHPPAGAGATRSVPGAPALMVFWNVTVIVLLRSLLVQVKPPLVCPERSCGRQGGELPRAQRRPRGDAADVHAPARAQHGVHRGGRWPVLQAQGMCGRDLRCLLAEVVLKCQHFEE